MQIKNLQHIVKTTLLKILAVLWFAPIYAGVLICLGQLIIWGHHKLGFWVVGETFANIILYASAFYYLTVLSYLALTQRTWVPNAFVRFSVQYLFKLPKFLKNMPVLLFSGFSGFIYFFLTILPLVEHVKNHLLTSAALTTSATPEEQTLIATTIAMSLSYALAMVVTHILLKHVPFVRVHCVHALATK